MFASKASDGGWRLPRHFLVGGGGKHACVIDVCWSFFVSSILLFTTIANVLSDLILFPQAWCYVTQVHVSTLQDGQ